MTVTEYRTSGSNEEDLHAFPRIQWVAYYYIEGLHIASSMPMQDKVKLYKLYSKVFSLGAGQLSSNVESLACFRAF